MKIIKQTLRKLFHGSDIAKSLDQIASEDAPMFSLSTLGITRAKIMSVYDGDTVTAAVEVFPETFYSFSLRLQGIDAPEMKPPLSATDRDSLVTAAKHARDFLSDLILGKVCSVQFFGRERWGRELCVIYPPGAESGPTVNDMLIQKGYARPYDGGTKG